MDGYIGSRSYSRDINNPNRKLKEYDINLILTDRFRSIFGLSLVILMLSFHEPKEKAILNPHYAG